MKAIEELDHYEVLEIEPGASPEEIERAYALVRAAYEGEALAAYSVFEPDEAKLWRERVDEAWRVLGDPEARRAYDEAREAARAGEAGDPGRDAGAGDGADGVAVPFEPLRRRAAAAPIARDVLPEPPRAVPRELEAFDDADDPDAPWDGARLRRSRVVRGIDLDRIAAATKINPTYLRFLEEERFDALPAVVYVRGFVAAYAAQLGLDAARVARSYAARCEEARLARGRGRPLGRS